MNNFRMPPVEQDSDGKPRVAGFELEFGNVTVAQTARALADKLGGELKEENPFVYVLEGLSIGDIRIERDAELLNTVKYRELLEKLNIQFDAGTLARELEQGVDRLSSNLVPCEIVTSPLKFADFDKLDQIVDVLNALEAQGTGESVVFAYGTHINPSTPALDAQTVTAYLQSFLLLSDWIIDASGTDFSRRYLTRFIDPFPGAYLKTVLRDDYAPSMEGFIDDYLEHNPTRNRSLDLLPMLSEYDSDRVLRGVKSAERSLIKSRPAFHYRLPDCRIGEPGWSVADEWNRWWYVEALAADNGRRKELLRRWRDLNDETFLPLGKNWIKLVDDFLSDNFESR